MHTYGWYVYMYASGSERGLRKENYHYIVSDFVRKRNFERTNIIVPHVHIVFMVLVSLLNNEYKSGEQYMQVIHLVWHCVSTGIHHQALFVGIYMRLYSAKKKFYKKKKKLRT